ncbi:SIS domain-containing protein [Listeria costaricensis]|uniref:SIS domain-containing protein n=1 Tax=Listeria costaricensis TaxID=2026604 RepID=UPI000C089ED4|nr:SIS domain-containing protein [Listeria costaricensis]
MFNLEEEALQKRAAIHTAGEIKHQGHVWGKVIELLKEKQAESTGFIERARAAGAVDVLFLGAGSSAFVSETVVPLLFAESDYPEFRYQAVATVDLVAAPKQYVKNRPTIAVSFGRSGNSPESIAAVDLLKQLVDQLFLISVTCNKDGELLKVSGQSGERHLPIVLPEETNDVSFAMTSSFTSMLMSSYALFHPAGMADWDAADLATSANQFLQVSEAFIMKNFAEKTPKRLIYLGSSTLKGIAHEASLKTLELSAGNIDASFESVLGFRHGPKSLMHKDTVVVTFYSADAYTRKYDEDIVAEMAADGLGNPLIVLQGEEETNSPAGVEKIQLNGKSGADPLLRNLLFLLFGQSLALYNSLALGITPDNPSPSGIVNRVVQGVTIHPYHEQ